MRTMFPPSHTADFIYFEEILCSPFFLLQKLKDVAFPQAEVLKKALLRRFDQEYAQYLVKKVKRLPDPHTQTC